MRDLSSAGRKLRKIGDRSRISIPLRYMACGMTWEGWRFAFLFLYLISFLSNLGIKWDVRVGG